MVGAIFAVLGVLIPSAIVGFVIYIIVSVSKNKDSKSKKDFKLPPKTLLQIYLYTLSVITLAAAVIGASTAIRAGAAYQFGMPFSYTLYKANNFAEEMKFNPELSKGDFIECYEGEPTIINEDTYCVDYAQRTSEVINGSIIFASMIILFGVHQYALSRIEKKLPWLDKIYTFASLIGYSLAGIISLIASISLISDYIVFANNPTTSSTTEAPAMAIAVAILTIPLWIYFIIKTLKLKD